MSGSAMTASRRVPLLVVVAYGTLLAVSLPVFPYGWHLVLHVVGAVLFLGNLIVSAAWVVLADLSGKREALAFASRTVSRADLIFTAPGALLLAANGIAMSLERWQSLPAILSEGWMSVSLVLFAASGVVWIALLVPQQRKLEALTAGGPQGDMKDAELRRTLLGWYLWGSLATILPLVALVLMILKPAFG